MNKVAAVGGSGGAALVVVLLVFGTGTPMEAPTQADKLPRVLGGSIPPTINVTDFNIGNEVPRFMDAGPGVSGQSERTVNPEHSKYDGLLVLDGYEHLHVYKDQRGDKDVMLGKEPVSPPITHWEALYSGQYIWITIVPNEKGYSHTMPLNKGYRWVAINDDIVSAAFKGMDQLVDWDGNDLAVRPSDLWFASDSLSYTIRGHISLEESLRLAHVLLSVEDYEPISSPKNGYLVGAILTDMTLSLSSGDILSVEVDEGIPAIVISVELDEDGRLVIENPMENLRKAFPNSCFDEYIILVDGEEVVIDEISMNIVALSVKEDSQRIEIFPFIYLSSPVQSNCPELAT